MFAAIRRSMVVAVAITVSMSGSAAAGKVPACMTIKCTTCQKQCYTTYEKEQNGSNWNPTTAPIYKKQYYACRRNCVAKFH